MKPKEFYHKKTGHSAIYDSELYEYDVYLHEEEGLLFCVPAWMIETNPEWLEVATKKDYEILKCSGWNSVSLKIHSVKRLLDGEVFSVRDKDEGGAVITNFTEDDGGINVGFGGYYRELNQIAKPAKKPVLTTEDGVELFEGDKYWWVDDDLDMGSALTISSDPAKGCVYFSTREAAEDYRLWHYVGLSLKDINNYDIPEESFAALEKLVKERI